MAKLLQANLTFSMATTAIAIILYCGVVILTMQLPTAMVSAHCGHSHHHHHHHHHAHIKASQTATTLVVPQNITLFSYTALQGANSTTGYNTAQCGGPVKPQPNGFAVTFCFETPLLSAQDPNSQLLGVLHGSYVFISLAAPGSTLFVSETFTLDTSSFPQGTFSATGLQSISQTTSKPITGGTDAFAFLTGVVTTTPLSSTATVDSNGNSVSWFKYDFTFRSASSNN